MNNMMKFSSQKNFTDFQDISAMISHPNLPLIFTGTKTNIDIWKFGCEELQGEL